MEEKEFSLGEIIALVESYSFLYSRYPPEEVTTYLKEAEALEGYTYYYPFSTREIEEDFLLSTKEVKVNSLIALKESYSLLYRERIASRVEGYLKKVEEKEGLTFWRDTFYKEGKLDKALLREDYYNYYS